MNSWKCSVGPCQHRTTFTFRVHGDPLIRSIIDWLVLSSQQKSNSNKFIQMKKVLQVVVVVLVVVVVVSSDIEMAEAVTCSPVELSPCLGPITTSSPPTSICCQKVREQRPCFCGYLKNPSLRQYVYSPGARRVASSCGVPFRTCS